MLYSGDSSRFTFIIRKRQNDIMDEHMNTQDEQDVSCTWQNLQRCHGKLCLGRKEVVERVHAREREGERERAV